MSVPVRDGKRSLGETVITILPGDKVTVSKSALLEMLAPVLARGCSASCNGLTRKMEESTLRTFAARGSNSHQLRSSSNLTFSPTIDQRATDDLSLAPLDRSVAVRS